VVDANLDDAVHAQSVVEILDSYARDPIGGGRPLSKSVRERLVPELRAQSHARILLALDGDRPIGVAVCFLGFSTFAARPLLNLHDLAVLPEQRGRGAGRALLEAVESRARNEGCCKVTLEVRQDNERARALYARVGFHDFAPGADAVNTRFLQKDVG
jgi:GNAT superfamily N-acetyltransferase